PEMPKGKAAKGARANARTAPVDEEEDEGDERDSIFDVILGYAVHVGFAARSALKRAGVKIAERRAAEREAEDWRGEAVEPSLGGRTPSVPPVYVDAPVSGEHRSIVGAH